LMLLMENSNWSAMYWVSQPVIYQLWIIMDLSSLIDLNPGIKVRRKDTDRLFYDQYHYGIDLRMEDISCLRSLSKTSDDYHKDILSRYHQKYRWTYRYHDRLIQAARDQEKLDLLYNLAELLTHYQTEIKLVVSGNCGYVYTNNIELMSSMLKDFPLHARQLRQACIVRPKNTVSLHNSPHQFRTYFREKSINQTEKQQLLRFLQTQTEWRVSESLKKQLRYQTHVLWLSRSYFIDHNAESEVLMLNLIVPGILQKTMPIIGK